MEKLADTRYPIHELIRNRWSPRAFGDRPVETAELYRLFEAARWAPSSFNEQPWGFIVATREKPEAHAAIGDCLVETNRWGAAAPVLMVSLAKLALSHNDKPNRHAHHDLGLAVGMMLVQATDLGIVSHQLGGFDVARARATLQIPESYDPVAILAFGYPGDAEKLSPELQKKEYAPRKRNDFEDFVWAETFGTPMPFESRVKRALQGD